MNAFVLPTGTIYLTTGLLQEKGLTDEELTFVLAHEIGHYRNRDHLKAISHNIGIMVITGLIGMNTNSTSNSTISSIGEMGSLAYSRKQETNADIYANETLIKIYGTNNGAIKFINRIKEKNSEPEFLKYFSTHPSWNDRLEISNSIQNQ